MLPISSDPGIRLMFNHLSPETQKAILCRDEIKALRSGELGIDEYLHIISNPKEGIVLA